MTDPLTFVPKQTVSYVWVFSLGIETSEMSKWMPPDPVRPNGKMKDWPLPAALGLETLPPAGAEVFEASSISEYGLARYLTDAHGFSDESVNPMADRLNGLTGPLVLLFSRDLPQTETTLRPVAPVNFVGRFATRPDTSLSVPIETQTARGQLSPQTEPAGPHRMPLWPFAVFVAVAVGLILVLLLSKV